MTSTGWPNVKSSSVGDPTGDFADAEAPEPEPAPEPSGEPSFGFELSDPFDMADSPDLLCNDGTSDTLPSELALLRTPEFVRDLNPISKLPLLLFAEAMFWISEIARLRV